VLTIQDAGSGSNAGSATIGVNAGSDGTLAITGSSSKWTVGGAVAVGVLGTGKLDVGDGGVLTTGADTNGVSGYVGQLAGSTGTATIHGDDSLWKAGGNLQIGAAGTGTLEISDQGTVNAAAMSVGTLAGGKGTVSITNGTLTLSDVMTVGDAGSGDVAHSGGTNTVKGSLILGKSAGGVGTYTLTQPQASVASSLSVGADLIVGDAGMGTFTHTGGSVTVNGAMTLGKSDGGNGIYRLSQSNSLIPSTLSVSGDAIIGDGGFGSFEHTGGSFTVNGMLTIGNGSTGSGAYSMSEADPQTITKLTTEGQLIIGNAGNGSFTQTGGEVEINDVVVLGGNGGTGSYTMSGSTSTLDADHEIIVNGTFSQSDGTNSIDQGKVTTQLGGTLTINGAGNYNLSGGSLEVENTETVQGAFNQTGGKNNPDGGLSVVGGSYSLRGGELIVGDDVSVFGGKFDQTGGAAQVGGSLTVDAATGTGSYTLGGTGTLLVTKDEVIGDSGKATFGQSGGFNTLVGGDLTLGKSAGGDGSYSLAQSAAQNQAVLQVGGNLIVGNLGTGTFTHSGGTVSVNSDLTLGNGDTGIGTYFLSQSNSQIPSQLQVLGNAIIGNSGTGTFTQSGGSVTIGGDMALGASTGGNGTFTLNQSDIALPASMQIGGNLVIGDLGTGAVIVTAGTATVGGGLVLGKSAGGSGSLTLNDPGMPASMQVSGDAIIGDRGAGTVTVSGGAMAVGGAMTLANGVGSDGSLTITQSDSNNSATLTIGGGVVVGNLGAASVSQTGGTTTVGASLTLGAGTGGSGSYTLAQADAQNPSQLKIGSDVVVGTLGSGSLTVDGGNLTVAGSLTAGQGTGSNGSISLAATNSQFPGQLKIGSTAIIGGLGAGSFTQTGGSLVVGGAVTLGQGAGGTGSLTLMPSSGQAATLAVGGNLVIGDLGTGNYEQIGGSATVGGSLIIGNGVSGNGSAMLAQGSGQSNSALSIGGNAIIGALGTGSFSQTGGTATASGTFTLGQSVGATGSYTLGELGGQNAPTLKVDGSAVIGDAGNGSFSENRGGATFGGTLALGQSAGGIGNYTLQQGSTLQVAETLTVGGLGTGSFTQSGGSATVGGALALGQSAGANGTYSITQNNATLIVGGALTVGDLGTGSFTQSSGTVQTGGSLALGNGASGSGSYALGPSSGLATPLVSVAGDEVIGNLGSGTFTQTGGTNNVGGTLTIAAGGGPGTYNFSGGAISAALIVNNGTLNLTGSGLITSGLVNSGNATATNAATVALAGNATNTGVMTISGATLSTQGNVTNAGGAVSIGTLGSSLIAKGTYTQTAGSTLLNGGALEGDLGIINQGGTIGGTGTLIGNVTVSGGSVQVGQSPDPLHIAGNLNQNGGHLLFEIDPNGAGGFLESTLVFDLGASIGIANTNITFDFLNGADPDTFFHDGLFNLETFFKVSNADPFGQNFSFGSVFQTDSFILNVPGETISGFDPATGALTLGAGPGPGPGNTSVPEPSTLALLALGFAGVFGRLRHRRHSVSVEHRLPYSAGTPLAHSCPSRSDAPEYAASSLK
jgi:T5SS/PEP-CTERM-associated repeat protein